MVCLFSLTGECSVAENLRFQADNGSINPEGANIWDRDNWEALVERSQAVIDSDSCSDPVQIKKALEEVHPIIVEQLK